MILRTRFTKLAILITLLAFPCVFLMAAGDDTPAIALRQKQLLERIEKLEARLAQLESRVLDYQVPVRQLPIAPNPHPPYVTPDPHRPSTVAPRTANPQLEPLLPGAQRRTINGIPYFHLLLSSGDETAQHSHGK